MNVLIIAPHPDDESIGCGGAICLHIGGLDRVTAVFLTSGERALPALPPRDNSLIREQEAQEAAGILGLKELFFLRLPDGRLADCVAQAAAALKEIIDREEPSLIYMPHPQEEHPDHAAAFLIVKAALERSGLSPELRGYEIWTPLSRHDQVTDISAVIGRKLNAVRCHRSQIAQLSYDRAVEGLNQYRGAMAGNTWYAEVFQSLKIPQDTPHEVEFLEQFV